MKLLLDTCTFLWLASGSRSISKPAITAFLLADKESYLSAASTWEVALKHALGRLPLPAKPHIYIQHIREKSGILSLPVDEESALYTARLPKLHTDPFDRVLIAQAIVHGMTIVTPDEAIANYGTRILW